MTIINHYGVWVDSNKPTTGVYNLNDCPEWYFGEDYIDLDYETWLKEHKLTCEACQNDEYCQELEYWECQPGDTKLTGQWIKDENGEYLPDENGEYAAIENESTVQVVWSKTVKRFRSLCSPCYPGQCSVEPDSEVLDNSGFLAYVLPE